ncbi:MAG TPA: hypothetical protein VM369_01165 [Candidatus Binatia bacterium]|nr:hypothetical protein [Candidatus Binatia bacterium]
MPDRSPNRRQYLVAGTAYASRLPQLRVTAVARAAGGSVAGLNRLFGSFSAYRVELMFHWLDGIRDAVAGVLARTEGPARLPQAVQTWLDANLACPAVRALMLEQRRDPKIAERIQQRFRGFVVVLQLELRERGWVRYEVAGRLYAAMAIEVAQSEFEAGRALPSLRETLRLALERP